MGQIYIISGVSGSGKSTISDVLIARHENLTRSVSVTTRAPRAGELFGYHYFFIDKERFQWMLDTHQILEHTNVYTENLYGTPKYSVEMLLLQGRDILFVVDRLGVEQITAEFPEAKRVFLAAPSEAVQRERIASRPGVSGEEVEQRLEKAAEELAWANEQGIAVVVGDVIARAVSEVEAVFGL